MPVMPKHKEWNLNNLAKANSYSLPICPRPEGRGKINFAPFAVLAALKNKDAECAKKTQKLKGCHPHFLFFLY
jgi:hypothetical protein